jgi:type I restriction enzyme, S subunit
MQLLARQSQLPVESRSLGDLRDILLPKLLSGELRVQDAERFVASAL